MQIFLLFLLSILLSLIAIQDFTSRAIAWIIFPAVTIILFLFHFIKVLPTEKDDYLWGIVYNIGFVTLQLLMLQIYFSIKTRSFQPIINSKIGLGDVFMFYALTVCFSPLHLFAFYIVSLLLSIAIAIIARGLSANTYAAKNIPLAGMMALFLLIFMLLNLFLHINTMDDMQLVNLLTKA